MVVPVLLAAGFVFGLALGEWWALLAAVLSASRSRLPRKSRYRRFFSEWVTASFPLSPYRWVLPCGEPSVAKGTLEPGAVTIRSYRLARALSGRETPPAASGSRRPAVITRPLHRNGHSGQAADYIDEPSSTTRRSVQSVVLPIVQLTQRFRSARRADFSPLRLAIEG